MPDWRSGSTSRGVGTTSRRAVVAIAALAIVAAGAGDGTLARAASVAGPSLAITLAISDRALDADTLVVHAYRVPASGPLAVLPSATVVAKTRVAQGSPNCRSAARTRTCRLSAPLPAGADAVVAVLTRASRVVGQAFVAIDTRGPASLALDAGQAPIGDLVIATPPAIQGRSFRIAVTTFARDGHVVLRDSSSAPIDVRVYGPPGVVPSPYATVGGEGSTASFAYSGRSFANAMTVTAVDGTMSNTAQIFPHAAGTPVCAPLVQSDSFTVPEPGSVRHGFGLFASVAGSKAVGVRLDTGSTSLAIAKDKISGAMASHLIGPGRNAQVTYEPSGVTLYGNYYLAPVGLYGDGGKTSLATTVPMEIFVATMRCTKHQTPPCAADTGTAYMGVGFGRPSPKPPALPGLPLMSTPLENPFMQLTAVVQGAMHPGFVLSRDSLMVGIDRAAVARASFVRLSPYPARRGDWQGPPACIRFNHGAYQCGRMLMDIGIASMFVHAKAPAALNDIEIVAPNPTSALVRYSFPYPVRPDATPPAPSPRTAKPVVFVSPPKPVFVNTGRDLLAVASFLYDAGCGRAGFERPS